MSKSKATNYEAPFLYLLFGNERAILLDTGATKDAGVFPLRETVDALIDGWLAEHSSEDPTSVRIQIVRIQPRHVHQTRTPPPGSGGERFSLLRLALAAGRLELAMRT